jgi:hypothetical protein
MTSKIAHGLIRSAARRAPEALSERLVEEWLADLSAQSGSISRLRFALGCCWASRVIAQEHAAPALPISHAPIRPGRAHFIRFPKEASPVLMSGTTTFALILALNAAVFYGLVLGLSHL